VRANQRETGGAVVERSGVPAFGGMASRANSSPQKQAPRSSVPVWWSVAISSNGIRIAADRRRYRQSVVVLTWQEAQGTLACPLSAGSPLVL